MPYARLDMKRKITRQERIYRVALAGISAAVALLCVWLGVVIRYSTVAFFIAAGIALMVPTSQKYYLSSVFAYLVSAGLSFLVAPDIFAVMGYVVYFGPMAVITGVLYDHRDKVKWWIALIIKVVYINGALALLYFVCHNIVIDESIADKLQYWAIALTGTVLLVAIDFALQFIYKRLAVIVAKALRKSSKNKKEIVINDDDDDDIASSDNPFDEFSDGIAPRSDDCTPKNGERDDEQYFAKNDDENECDADEK